MTIAAGIDVGNATTEVVLARLGGKQPEVLAAGRAPTRRAKGGPESLDGAVTLLRRLEREHGIEVEVAAAAPLRPVWTETVNLPEPLEPTGRLRLVPTGGSTTGGSGFGVGPPLRLGESAEGVGAVVALVPAGTGYLAAFECLHALREEGRLAAVVLADDEAVLVANRLGGQVPVVDEVDLAELADADLLAVEVAGAGGLRSLTDPLRLLTSFELDEDERADAARIARRVHDLSSAVVARGPKAEAAPALPAGWVELTDGTRVPLPGACAQVRAGGVGHARAYALPGCRPLPVDDLWCVDLTAVADTVLTRTSAVRTRAAGLAVLRADAPYTDPSPYLAERLGITVRTAPSEAAAARTGALSTPGAESGAVVVDLGAGTVDTVAATGAVVAAGGGHLLTASVAALTGTTSAAAEWVKRGAAHRVEAPQVLLGEDGSRGFLDHPTPAGTVGALVVHGPAGLLPFSRMLSPGEWRALRLRLKVELLAGNLSRALRTLDTSPTTVIVVGGPAGDDEVLTALSRSLPQGTAVGRGDVAGVLGHRYAVAYGLLDVPDLA